MNETAVKPGEDFPAPKAQRGAGTIAYLSSMFPLRSETFVYREVVELLRRGWEVPVFSLHHPPHPVPAECADLQPPTVLYRAGMLRRAAGEAFAHPLRAISTLALATKDAIAPGEKLGIAGRCKLIWQAVAGISLAGSLRSAKARHLHCHFAHSPTSVGMYAAHELGIGFSVTGHANDLFQRRALLRRKLQRAAFVSCISEWHRELYRSLAPDHERAYRVIRCGVDIGGFHPTTINRPDSSSLRVLTVCRLVEKKGVDTLIRALHALGPADGVSWQLRIVGDGPEQPRLRQLAQELECEAAIEWLGEVENQRIAQLLAEADVFALPCRASASGDRDGIPVVLIEAMACGVAVVSGDLPAIRELIIDGQNGRLVDGQDVAGLTRILAELAHDATLRRELAESGRRRVEQEFPLSKNIDRLEQALREAIEKEDLSGQSSGFVQTIPSTRADHLVRPEH